MVISSVYEIFDNCSNYRQLELEMNTNQNVTQVLRSSKFKIFSISQYLEIYSHFVENAL